MGKFFAIPRVALRDGDVVWILAEDEVLDIVEVEVIRSERNRVIIRAKETGEKKLTSGDGVIISPIAIPVSGMKLNVDKN